MPTLSTPHFEPIFRTPLLRSVTALYWRHERKGYSVMAPANFISDGSSVPNPGWTALKAKPTQMIIPGMLHDYTVRVGAEVIWDDPATARELDAELAIEIMDDVMEWNGICEWDRNCVAKALRLTVPLYWHHKPVMWDGLGEPKF